jgi:tetratricopeptide (TPR) repeat protein
LEQQGLLQKNSEEQDKSRDSADSDTDNNLEDEEMRKEIVERLLKRQTEIDTTEMMRKITMLDLMQKGAVSNRSEMMDYINKPVDTNTNTVATNEEYQDRKKRSSTLYECEIVKKGLLPIDSELCHAAYNLSNSDEYGDRIAAIEKYKQALELSPNDTAVLTNISLSYYFISKKFPKRFKHANESAIRYASKLLDVLENKKEAKEYIEDLEIERDADKMARIVVNIISAVVFGIIAVIVFVLLFVK